MSLRRNRVSAPLESHRMTHVRVLPGNQAAEEPDRRRLRRCKSHSPGRRSSWARGSTREGRGLSGRRRSGSGRGRPGRLRLPRDGRSRTRPSCRRRRATAGRIAARQRRLEPGQPGLHGLSSPPRSGATRLDRCSAGRLGTDSSMDRKSAVEGLQPARSDASRYETHPRAASGLAQRRREGRAEHRGRDQGITSDGFESRSRRESASRDGLPARPRPAPRGGCPSRRAGRSKVRTRRATAPGAAATPPGGPRAEGRSARQGRRRVRAEAASWRGTCRTGGRAHGGATDRGIGVADRAGKGVDPRGRQWGQVRPRDRLHGPGTPAGRSAGVDRDGRAANLERPHGPGMQGSVLTKSDPLGRIGGTNSCHGCGRVPRLTSRGAASGREGPRAKQLRPENRASPPPDRIRGDHGAEGG